MGCDGAPHARRARRRRRRLRAADAARAHEPELGAVAARVRRGVPGQRPPARAAADPDAPGPVNRGVELAARSRLAPGGHPHQVEAGVVVRMAVLYEVLAGAPRRGARTGPPALRMTASRDRHPGGRPPTCSSARRTSSIRAPGSTARPTCSSAAARSPRSARRARSTRPRAPRSSRAQGRHLLPGVRRPARPPAHARPGAQGGPRDRHPRGGGRRLLRGRRRCRTPTRSSTPRRCCARCATPRARDARIPVGFLAAITRGLHGDELTEMAELRDDGRGRLHRRRRAGRTAPGCCATRCSTSACAAACSRCTRRTPRCRATARCTRARSARCSAWRGSRRSRSRRWSRATRRSRGYEGGRVHMQHLSARESVEAVAEAKAAGVQVSCEAIAAPPVPDHEAVRDLDTRMKMNPPLRTEARPPGADRRACATASIDCIATDHAPHARDEKEVPFEQAPMGTTGLETAFAAVHTELVAARACCRWPRGRALDERRARCSTCRRRAIEVGAPANLTLVDLGAGVGGRRERLRVAQRELLLRRAHAQRQGLLTVAAGAVAYRERARCEVAA